MMKYVNIVGYACIVLAFGVHFWIGHGKSWEPTATFLLAALGVIPLAHLMGESTESLAERVGPTWGGLLNATFGNAAELIIAGIALTKGLNEVVKASLTGSILGNLLLVGGAAMLAGGWKRERQKFNPAAAETGAGMLVIGVAAMLVPAIFHYTAERLHDVQIVQHEKAVSVGTSIVLILVYGLGLLFTLRTHAHIYAPKAEHTAGDAGGHGPKAGHEGHSWSVKKAVTMLLVASAGIGIVAELLVGSAEAMAHNFGWSSIFVGVILLAIIGNAAEHSTAVLMAMKDDMDTAMTITWQSSLQIALFAVPFLVFLSLIFEAMGVGGGKAYHLDLIFTPLEVVAVILCVMVAVVLGLNGQTNWFEGVMLLALYAILGLAFFYVPEAADGAHGAAGAAAAGAAATMPAVPAHP